MLNYKISSRKYFNLLFFTAIFLCYMTRVSISQQRTTGQREHFRVPEIKIETIERNIDVGGRKLNCRMYGKGEPVVVLISGFGALQEIWNPIITDIAEITTVITYDRAGYGKSEIGDLPTHGEQSSKDLNILLEKLGISGKCIFLGHSYGGRILRIFASMYPEKAAGMIIEDTSYEDMRIYMRKILKGEELEFFKRFESMSSGNTRNPRTELDYLNVSWEQVQRSGPLPEVPLTVLTAGILPEHRDFSRETGNRLRKKRMEGQKKLAQLVPGGKHIIVEDVGHIMHLEKPEPIIDAVIEMVKNIRNKSR
ncbi:alpha/beta fold hydrolase [candidate division KSB1 bacterium]